MEWGKKNAAIASRSEKEIQPEDWITIFEGDKKMAPYVVRKGAGAGWLEFCKKPAIKIVSVFDTVGSLGYPVNIFVVSKLQIFLIPFYTKLQITIRCLWWKPAV